MFRVIFLTTLLTIANSAFSEPFTAGLTALSRNHATTAFRAWMKVAKNGVAEGQNNVAYLYERGMGVKQNFVEAQAWYTRAADQNLPAAMYNLAMLTYKGEINNRDTRKSVEWLRKADQLGHIPSTYMLGVLYMRGEGIFKNVERAFELFLKAASQGSVRAQYMVGYIYQSGMADPDNESDSERGYLWSAVALINGFDKARLVMINAAKKMSDNEEAELIKIAERCVDSQYQDCSL